MNNCFDGTEPVFEEINLDC